LNQIGPNLLGIPDSNPTKKVEYGASVQLSSDTGDILAVGAPHHGYNSSTADPSKINTEGGGVFVYKNNGNEWNLLSFFAGLPSEQIGNYLALSADGSRIAIRRNKTLSPTPNQVEVYDITSEGVTSKVGSDLSCGGNGDSVSLSANGNRIAVSCHSFSGSRGIVEIFDWANGAWSSIGQVKIANTTGANNNDRFGWVVSLDNSGNRLAVSAPNFDGGLSNRGLVRVYEYANNQWIQIGGDIQGLSSNDVFGYAMDLSGDGLSVAVGAYQSDVGGVTDTGAVSVFTLPPGATNWIGVGQLVVGETLQRFGRSVSISTDGKRVAASSEGVSTKGHMKILDFNGTQWEISGEVLGSNNQERLGYAVQGVTLTGDGSRVASGSMWGSNAAGNPTGVVRVFENLIASIAPSSSPSVILPVVPSSTPSVAPSSTPTGLKTTVTPTATTLTASPSNLVTAVPTTVSSPSSNSTQLEGVPVSPNSSVTPNATPTTAPTESPVVAATSVPTSGQDTGSSLVPISTPAPFTPLTSVTSSIPTVKLSKFDWDLERVGNATAVFSDGSNTEEITLNYNISNRLFTLNVFDESCTIPVLDNVVGITGNATVVTSTHSNLKVSLDVKQEGVIGSVVWSNGPSGVGFVNLCVRVDLVLDNDNTISINFHEQKLFITIGLEQGFSVVGVSLDRDAADEDNEAAEVDYAILACQCNASFVCGNEILVQGSDVYICVYSESDGVQVAGISALTFQQGDTFSTVPIFNSTEDPLTAVFVSAQGALIRSQMRSGFFTTINPLPVEVNGVAVLSFSNTGGRRLIRSVSYSRVLREAESSDFNVTLGVQNDPATTQVSGAGRVAGTVVIVFITIGAGLLSLFGA
jgi:hypothetical protein